MVLMVPLSYLGLQRLGGVLLFLTLGFFLLAVSLTHYDPWAGAFATYAVLRWWAQPLPYGIEEMIGVVFGVSVIVAAQHTPARFAPALKGVAVVAALIQVQMMVWQHFRYEPLWMWLDKHEWIRAHGTLGNPMYAGAFIAIGGALAPVWALPFVFLGVLLSKSATAGLAFALALCVRYRRHWRYVVPLAIAGLAWVMFARTWVTWTWVHRAAIWTAAFYEWTYWPGALWKWLVNILFGAGPGGWIRGWPRVGQEKHYEIFAQAHSEYVQMIFEGGLVAFAIFLGWLWYHRHTIMRSEWLPSALALAVIAVGFFPFQIAGTAVLSLTALGMVTRREGT